MGIDRQFGGDHLGNLRFAQTWRTDQQGVIHLFAICERRFEGHRHLGHHGLLADDVTQAGWLNVVDLVDWFVVHGLQSSSSTSIGRSSFMGYSPRHLHPSAGF